MAVKDYELAKELHDFEVNHFCDIFLCRPEDITKRDRYFLLKIAELKFEIEKLNENITKKD